MVTDTSDSSASAASTEEDDSSVIKALRAEVKSLKKAAPDMDDLLVKMREEVLAELAVRGTLIDSGLDEAQADELLKEVGSEGIAAAMLLVNALSPASEEGASDEDDESSSDDDSAATNLASTVKLGDRVAAAASGEKLASVLSKLANAESREDLNELAAEAGLMQQHV